MIEIDAVGIDGQSILPDLQGASPTGGFVTSESRPCEKIAVGHLVRHNGWSVVAGIAHDGVFGLCRLALVDCAGEVSSRSLYRGQSDEVRTDAAISPDSIYKLPRRAGAPDPGDAALAFAAQVAALPGTGNRDGSEAAAAGILGELAEQARALLGQQRPAGESRLQTAAAYEAEAASTARGAAGAAALSVPAAVPPAARRGGALAPARRSSSPPSVSPPTR